MRIVDFTHIIEPTMPVYPGTEPPHLTAANTYEKDGFRETLLEIYSHTGTHMDAPAHIIPGRPTLDALPTERFVGKALVIDCSCVTEGEILTMAHLAAIREKADRADFLLFRTGWDCFWGREEYFGSYPVIGPDVVEYLIETGKKGVGLDVISVDAMGAELPNHRRLLEAGVLIVENLKGLEQAGDGLFTFCSLPLHYGDADGAPIRAIGILDSILAD